MTTPWELWLESLLLLVTVVGVSVSLLLTVDSWVRYWRVQEVLDGNYFPRMHLRVDGCLLIVQILMGSISLIWLAHLQEREPSVLAASRHLWPVFPLRLVLVALVTATQVWNARDRHRMHFGERKVLYDRRIPRPAIEKEK